MKIGQRLILGFLGVALLVGVVGYIGVHGIRTVVKYADIEDANRDIYNETAKLEVIILGQVHESMHLLAFGEESCIEATKKLGEDFRKQLEEVRNRAPELKDKIQTIKAAQEKFEEMFNGTVKAHYAGQLAAEEQKREMHGKWCLISDEVIEDAKSLQPLFSEKAEKAHEMKGRVTTATHRNTMLASIVILLLALGVGFFIVRTIVIPLTKLKDAVNEIGKGKLDTRVAIKSKDEIGFLAASFNKMAEGLSGAMEKEKKLTADDKKKAEKLAALNEELESTNEEIRQTNEELESTNEELRVANEEAQRAKQLAEKKAEDYERFNKVAVGREIKIKELKARIAELEGKLKSREP